MKRWIAAALVACGLAVVLMSPSHRLVRVHNDSVNYISITRSLLAGDGPVNNLGTTELSHPFGYSLMLVPFMAAGMDDNGAAIAVNLLCLIAAFLISRALMIRLLGSDDWRSWAGAALVTATPALFDFSQTALSDTPFLVTALGYLLLLLNAKDSRRWLIVAAVAGPALCFMRYTGLAIVLCAGMTVPDKWRDRLMLVAPTMMIFAAGLTLTRALSPYLGLELRGSWATTWHAIQAVQIVATGWPILLITAGLVWYQRRDRPILTLAASVVGYVALLIVITHFLRGSSPTTVNIALDNRLFILPAVLITLLMLVTVARQIPRLFPFLVVGLSIYTAHVNAVNGEVLRQPAAKGFNSPGWKESKAISFIRELPEDARLYTTHPSAVWYLTRRQPYELPQHAVWGQMTHVEAQSDIRRDGGIAVWFSDGMPPVFDMPEAVEVHVGPSRFHEIYQDSSCFIAEVVQ